MRHQCLANGIEPLRVGLGRVPANILRRRSLRVRGGLLGCRLRPRFGFVDLFLRRSVVLLGMKNYAGARNDLEKYLALAPDCPDRAEMQKQLRAIKRYIVGMN